MTTIGAVALIDNAATLMVRAGTQLSAGHPTTARHLLASAMRRVDDARVMPLPGGDLTAASRSVLDLVSDQALTAHGLLRGTEGAVDAARATAVVDRSIFLMNLLRPGLA